jgi:hypothetical protein
MLVRLHCRYSVQGQAFHSIYLYLSLLFSYSSVQAQRLDLLGGRMPLSLRFHL